MKKYFFALFLLASLVACSDDEPGAGNPQAFTKANQGPWFGRYEVENNQYVDFYWLITPDARILSWKGDFDGECFQVSEDRIDVEMNTRDQFVFTFKDSDGKEFTYTLTKDGPWLNALITDGQQSILIPFLEASVCYSTGR